MRNHMHPPQRAIIVPLVAAAIVGLSGCASTSSAPAAPATPAVAMARSENPELEKNKALAVDMVKKLFEQGDLSFADTYLNPYLQHHPGVPDGAEPLKEFVRTIRAQYPNMKYDVKRVVAEGDLVVMHSNVVYTPGERGLAVVDIFRFENGLFAEHWDVVQEVPEPSPNGRGMF